MAKIYIKDAHDVHGQAANIGDIIVEDGFGYLIVGETARMFLIASEGWFYSNLKNINTLKDIKQYCWRTNKNRTYKTAIVNPDILETDARDKLLEIRDKILEIYG